MSEGRPPPQDTTYRLRHDSFQTVMVDAFMTGIYTSIFVFAVHKLVSQRGIRSTVRPLMIIITMYACAIVHLAFRWRYHKEAFVDNAQSVESTYKSLTAKDVVRLAVTSSVRGLLFLVADCVMIWRCWRLYSGSWTVIALPMFFVLGELVALIGRIVYRLRRETGTSGTLDIASDFNLAHLSLTLATTVVVTLLIVYRIVRMGGGRKYRGIIGIIVESSALYAVAIIVYLPFLLHPTLLDAIPYAVLAPTPGIATTLMIARVSLGQGFQATPGEKGIASDTDRNRQVSNLQFCNTNSTARDEVTGSSGPDVDPDVPSTEDRTLTAGWNSGSLKTSGTRASCVDVEKTSGIRH